MGDSVQELDVVAVRYHARTCPSAVPLIEARGVLAQVVETDKVSLDIKANRSGRVNAHASPSRPRTLPCRLPHPESSWDRFVMGSSRHGIESS